MQYPRVVGAYPAAGQFLRADLATIILYSKERVGKYPAVIYSVLMFPPSFIIPISKDSELMGHAASAAFRTTVGRCRVMPASQAMLSRGGERKQSTYLPERLYSI